jgi:hypothetical protein
MKTKLEIKRDAAIIFKAEKELKERFIQKAEKFGGMTAVLLNFVHEFVKEPQEEGQHYGQ